MRAQELWSVDNLNIANMDWEKFADQTDAAGVFRGLSEGLWQGPASAGKAA